MKRFFRSFPALMMSALIVLSLFSGPAETAPYSFEGLGILPGFSDRYSSLNISANGKVVVGWGYSNSNGGVSQAFRWTSEGGMVGLGTFPGGISSRALGVSAESCPRPIRPDSFWVWSPWPGGLEEVQKDLSSSFLLMTNRGRVSHGPAFFIHFDAS